MNTLINTSFSPVAHYAKEYQRLAKSLAGYHLKVLQTWRKTALDNFVTQGFPTKKHPDWKYTALTPLLQIPFSILPKEDHNKPLALSLTASNNNRLVFINGHFAPSLSQLSALPKNVGISNLASIINHDPTQLFNHWHASTEHEKNSLINLNTAFMHDGAYIYLPANTEVHSPIELLFISTDEQHFVPIRNIIIAKENSRAIIIEKYLSLTPTTHSYFTNTVSDCFLEAESQLEHYKLIAESEKSIHIGNLCVSQQKASQFSAYSIALNGGLVRSDSHIKLNQEQAQCQLKGLYYAHDKQHIDQQTVIDHRSPATHSKEFYKGIVADHASAVFNGKVIVRAHAAKSKAEQLNKNLLLSPYAEVNSKPQLEIFVDDIQCTHGASIGQLDETALFYLRTRGISASEARKILINAFIHDIIQQMPLLTTHPFLFDSLNSLLAFIPQDQVTQQTVS